MRVKELELIFDINQVNICHKDVNLYKNLRHKPRTKIILSLLKQNKIYD